jgi:hypothetical protein
MSTVNDKDENQLRQELEEFQQEKEQIKEMIGRIGGRSYTRKDNIINAIFLAVIVFFFVMEVGFGLIPAFVSLEISVLLVSVKIVWMIHSHNKFYHFQFWVLNSIEFRINELSKKVRSLDNRIENSAHDSPTSSHNG